MKMKRREMVKKVLSIVVMAGGLVVLAHGARADALRDLGVINEQQRQELYGAHEYVGKPLDSIPDVVKESLLPPKDLNRKDFCTTQYFIRKSVDK